MFLEGRYLSIPTGNFVVAEACSGINYLIATLAVATMFMYLRFRSLWRRVLFMLLAIAVPLIANGLRAYGIVMIAHLSDYRYALGVDHLIYGWVFFGVVIFALFALGNLFSDEEAAPVSVPQLPGQVRPARASVIMVLTLAAALVPRGLLASIDSARPISPAIELPRAPPGWSGPDPLSPTLGARFDGVDQMLAATYVAEHGAHVILEVFYYRSQGDGQELVNQSNKVFDETLWRQLAHGHRELPDSSPVTDVVELHLRAGDGSGEYLLWYWYETPGSRSANRLRIKFGEARARMAGRPGGGAVTTVRTAFVDGSDPAAVLQGFVNSGVLTLERMQQAR